MLLHRDEGFDTHSLLIYKTNDFYIIQIVT